MFRRVSLTCIQAARATPKRNKKGPNVVHQSQQPAAMGKIDFSKLDLKYKTTVPEVEQQKGSGWTPPPEKLPNLPFMVTRSHLSKSLPVYTAYKGGGTKVVTIVRKVSGDVKELINDMETVCDDNEVIVRPGKLVVSGNYHWRLKNWLTQLGF